MDGLERTAQLPEIGRLLGAPGGNGRSAFLSGEAVVGKSALVRRLCKSAGAVADAGEEATRKRRKKQRCVRLEQSVGVSVEATGPVTAEGAEGHEAMSGHGIRLAGLPC